MKKEQSQAPPPAPSDFDPTSLLKPLPKKSQPKVSWDDLSDLEDDNNHNENMMSDDASTGKPYKVDHRGKVVVINGREVIVGSRGGAQEEEEDSDDEKDTNEKWDRMLLRMAEEADRLDREKQVGGTKMDVEGGSKVAEGMKEHGPAGTKRKITVQLVDDEDGDSDDESDIDMKLDAYMEAMDQELSKTKVGKDFEKISRGEERREGAVSSEGASKPGRGGLRWGMADGEPMDDMDDDDFDEDDMQPVDVDLNLVKNLLDSFTAQQGLPGPASNILGRMGLSLPKNIEE
jgi:hypothetical protein